MMNDRPDRASRRIQPRPCKLDTTSMAKGGPQARPAPPPDLTLGRLTYSKQRRELRTLQPDEGVGHPTIDNARPRPPVTYLVVVESVVAQDRSPIPFGTLQ